MAKNIRGRGSDPTEPDAVIEPERVVQSVGFKPEQWDAIVRAADAEGHQPGPWIRAAALKVARELGFWNPLEQPGPRKTA